MSRIALAVFGISPEEATFARRGIPATEPSLQQHLESIGRTFIEGYRLALGGRRAQSLADELSGRSASLRGFAFEGAAMGLALLDLVSGGRRWRAFSEGPGRPFHYLLLVGAGWALARVPWRRWRLHQYPLGLDPFLGWLTVDGYGFHQGYFHARRFVFETREPREWQGYARRAFDQGLGRSIWFVLAADPRAIAARIAAFDAARRQDLWSGAGLAAAYAGGANRSALEEMLNLAYQAGYVGALRQGAVFAADARAVGDSPAEATELACRVLLGASAESAAALASTTRPAPSPTSYEAWRARLQQMLNDRSAVGSAR